jgi:nicotinic acid mononucleotide adenylyltransferase
MSKVAKLESFNKLHIDDEFKKGIVYTFGRFNPFTKGHNNMVKTIKKVARELENKTKIKYDKIIFVSNPKPPPLPNLKTIQQIKKSARFTPSNLNRNPFNVYEKVYWMEKLATKDITIINTATKNIKNWDDAVNWLKSEGYKDIHMVVGTDRYTQLKANTKKLAEWNKDKSVKFSVVESKRTEESVKELYKGFEKLSKKEKKTIRSIYSDKEISATKMRAAAASHLPGKNDIGKKIFRVGVGSNLSDKNMEQLITALKKKMYLNPNKAYIDTVNEGVSKNTRSKIKGLKPSKKTTTIRKTPGKKTTTRRKTPGKKTTTRRKTPSKKTTTRRKTPSKKTTTRRKTPSKKTAVRRSRRIKNKTQKTQSKFKNQLSVIVEE